MAADSPFGGVVRGKTLKGYFQGRKSRQRWHRRIGRIVKRRLGAKVVGRSLPLDPAVELIESNALLAPRKRFAR